MGAQGTVVSKQEGRESSSRMGRRRWSLLEILPRVLDAFNSLFLCLPACLVAAWFAPGF